MSMGWTEVRRRKRGGGKSHYGTLNSTDLITSFYFTNFPTNYHEPDMKKTFARWGVVKEVFIVVSKFSIHDNPVDIPTAKFNHCLDLVGVGC